ncbi:MAG: TatD family hydrolase [Clostridia bacterium]
MIYYDTHAHYNDEKYNGVVDETLKECFSVGVKKINVIGYNVDSSLKAIELSNMYNEIYSVIGIHPSDVGKCSVEEIERIYNENNNGKIVAIGEIGLDYYWVKDNKEEQKKLFIDQIELANRLKLPIVVHSRDASLDTYLTLKEHPAKYGTLLHCFSPTEDLVRLVLENGYMVAFGGNITYNRAKSFQKYMDMIPIEQIVIETDAPYLPPEPLRGTINSSKNLPIVLNKLAEYKKIDVEKLSEIVYRNSLEFFNIKE